MCVGADGANGIVARAVQIELPIEHGVALEGNVPFDEVPVDGLEHTAVVELGTVPGGYGWVFPKGDHANLGVGGWGSEGPRLRHHLDELARRHDVDPAHLTEVRGHRLPMRRLGSPAQRGRALLVGDAAGLVDPLSGDGMYEAFTSAKLAADAVIVAASSRGTPPHSRPRSTATRRRRGRRSGRSTGTRSSSSQLHARPASSPRSPGSSAASSPTRRMRRGSPEGR